MPCTGFRQASLDCFVHIKRCYACLRDALVSVIHHREIFNMLDSIYSNASFHPASVAVSEVVPAVSGFVDSVGRIGMQLLDFAPCPCPLEVGEAVLLFRLIVYVDRVQRDEVVAHASTSLSCFLSISISAANFLFSSA